jgi:hypothetical protein
LLDTPKEHSMTTQALEGRPTKATKTVPAMPDDVQRTIVGVMYGRVDGRTPGTREPMSQVVYGGHVDKSHPDAEAIRASPSMRFMGPDSPPLARFQAACNKAGCAFGGGPGTLPMADALAGVQALFDPGRAYYASGVFPNDVGFGTVEGAALVARHAAGDLGAYGNVADVQLDDDRRWCPEIFGVATVAARAIETGVGLIASRFEILIPSPDPRSGPRPRSLDILTLIGTSLGNLTVLAPPRLRALDAALGTGSRSVYVRSTI